MKLVIILVLISVCLNKSLGKSCASEDDCNGSTECCMTAHLWTKGICKKFERKNSLCSKLEEKLDVFGGKYFLFCPCDSGMDCMPRKENEEDKRILYRCKEVKGTTASPTEKSERPPTVTSVSGSTIETTNVPLTRTEEERETSRTTLVTTPEEREISSSSPFTIPEEREISSSSPFTIPEETEVTIMLTSSEGEEENTTASVEVVEQTTDTAGITVVMVAEEETESDGEKETDVEEGENNVRDGEGESDVEAANPKLNRMKSEGQGIDETDPSGGLDGSSDESNGDNISESNGSDDSSIADYKLPDELIPV